jgi:transcriptional regulator with XRE-family HTH domain
LGELVGRTEGWVQKVETGRHEIDRVSVLRQISAVLGVGLADLLGAQVLLQWQEQEEHASVPQLRAALTDYRQFLPVSPAAAASIRIDLEQLAERLTWVWEDYQASRYNRVVLSLPSLISDTVTAARHLTGDDRRRALRQAASVHQLVGVFVPKLGETDLASLAATKGLDFAQQSGDNATVAALYRIAGYTLASLGEHGQAVALVESAISVLAPELSGPDATGLDLSVWGMLHLVAGRAAAQADNRGTAQQHLHQAQQIAERLGGDHNFGYTGFGPTNVVMHRVVIHNELGEMIRAAEIGPTLDTRQMPTERRGRHAIESARALAGVGRQTEAVHTLLDAEQYAQEQILHHALARNIVRRTLRGRSPDTATMALADRMGLRDL